MYRKQDMRNNEIMIPWRSGDSVSSWNELCARVVEHFGLPGGRYTTEVSADWMGFKFLDEKDAFVCKLMLSEHL